jgi:hypothetical protein
VDNFSHSCAAQYGLWLKEQDLPRLSQEEERVFNFVNNVPVEPGHRNGNNQCTVDGQIKLGQK